MKISQVPSHNSGGAKTRQRDELTGKNGVAMSTERGRRNWISYGP